jgi:hypothetical protein
MIMVRFADDIVVGFEHESDARRFWDAMRDRLQEFSLSLHPDKTRLIEFGRHAAANRARRGLGKPETFKFLGFVLISGRSPRGRFLVVRKSRRDRMRATLREIGEELRRRRHEPIPETGRWLAQVVKGYFGYHAVPTNGAALSAFRYHVVVLWHRQLCRRSQRARLTWERMTKLVADYLPKARILHPWPSVRFAVRLIFYVRRAKARFPSGRQTHPATFAPAGSNRSSRGGDETAEASGVEGHCW